MSAFRFWTVALGDLVAPIRRRTLAFIGAGLVGVVLSERSAPAQVSSPPDNGLSHFDSVAAQAATARLGFSPEEAATGTRTSQAGEYELANGYRVYVPPQCVGAERAPLVVFFHGEGGDARHVVDWQRQFADQYGMILLAPNASMPGRWDLIQAVDDRLAGVSYDQPVFAPRLTDGSGVRPYESFGGDDPAKLLDALKQVLHDFAIDPRRIALAGLSEGGAYAAFLGSHNPEKFSRIAVLSPAVDFTGSDYAALRKLNRGGRMYLSVGLREHPDYVRIALSTAERARRNGYAVEHELLLGGHEETLEGYARMWQWLNASWAKSGVNKGRGAGATSSRRSRQILGADTAAVVPLLTVDALKRMAAFWTQFARQPDSIRAATVQAPTKRLLLPVGRAGLTLTLVDMAALAARYPAVAADLKGAGLTARQVEGYTLALISAKALRAAGETAGIPEATSTLGRNQSVLETQQDALTAVAAASRDLLPVAWRW